ncbi:hypothetical protein MJO28_016417, partial [Puccinia striiformis f. sp. tritici]
ETRAWSPVGVRDQGPRRPARDIPLDKQTSHLAPLPSPARQTNPPPTSKNRYISSTGSTTQTTPEINEQMTSIIRFFQRGVLPTDPQRPSQTHILLRESTQDTYYYFASFYYLVRTLSSPLLRPFFTNQTGLPFKLPLQRYFGSSPEGTWIRPISTISIQAFFDLIKNVQTGLDDISLDRLPFESRIKDPIVDVIIHDLAEQQCDQSGKISTPDYINL